MSGYETATGRKSIMLLSLINLRDLRVTRDFLIYLLDFPPTWTTPEQVPAYIGGLHLYKALA